MLILLTNDDGYRAAGLQALRDGLARIGRVVTVAPVSEMSGVSHALTLSRPLSVDVIAPDLMAVDGTPTDCVNLAMNELLGELPHVCVAGVNHGPNLGDDVTYSGTVGAALEGTLFGVPSVAVSQIGGGADADFSVAAEVAASLAEILGRRRVRLPPGSFLNVNLPEGPPLGVSATRLARRTYRNGILTREDPRGRTYYWVGGEPVWDAAPGTDQHAVTGLSRVSVSLLGADLSLSVPGAPAARAVEGCVDAGLEEVVRIVGEALGRTGDRVPRVAGEDGR